MKTIHRTLSSALLCTATIPLTTLFAGQADAFTLSGSSGTWSNTIGGTNINIETVGDENQVRWGSPASLSGQSGLGFSGVGEIALDPDEVFQVGTLRHFNNPIFANSAASAVTFSVALDFGDPDIDASFSFDLEIDETPNIAGTCAYFSTTPCADRISFVDPFASETFAIDNILYTLEIVGFSDSPGGEIVTSFISQEGGTNSASLFARVTTSLLAPGSASAIPEPATIAGLVAIAGGFSLRRRKR